MAGITAAWGMMDPTMRLSKEGPELPIIQIPIADDEQDVKLSLSSPVMPSSPSFFNTTFNSWPISSPVMSPMTLSPEVVATNFPDSPTLSIEPLSLKDTGQLPDTRARRARRRKNSKISSTEVKLRDIPAKSGDKKIQPPNVTGRRQSNKGADVKKPLPKRTSSIEVGKHISDLLHAEEVQAAVHVLQEATKFLDMANVDQGDAQTLAPMYSNILLSLCGPKVLELVMDVSSSRDIVDTIIWKLFAKVVAAGYILDREVYVTLANLFVKYDHFDLAQQAIYSLPRQQWNTEVYKIAIMLHLLKEPKQVQEVESLLSDYGQPSIEVTNPISPTRLPPIHIETPLMKDVTDEDKKMLWLFYQTSLDNSDWGRAKDQYEIHDDERRERRNTKDAQARPRGRRMSLIDWAIQGTENLMGQQNPDRCKKAEETQSDNAMIYTAICNQQYEYGWHIFDSMGDNVDRHTSRIVMRLCRCAFNAVPVANVSTKFQWEQRAWRVYSKFMLSEHFDPRLQETHAFLRDILFICANSTEREGKIRYTKATQVLKLLERQQLYQMTGDEYVMMPLFCILLEQCHGVPDTVVTQCERAFELWKRMQDANMHMYKEVQPPSQSFCWMMLLFIQQSGSVSHFQVTMKYIKDLPLSESLVAPIQYIHDKFLSCKIPDKTHCYFSDYMYHDTAVGPDAVAKDHDEHNIVINQMGFTEDNVGSEGSNSQGPRYIDPIAHLKNAYKRNITISDHNAVHVAKFAALGPVPETILDYRTMHYSNRKAKALVRHCLVASKKPIASLNQVQEH